MLFLGGITILRNDVATSKGFSNKTAWYYFNSLIAVMIMISFQYLPPIGQITPLGMSVVGIFLGIIYAWSTVDIIWPAFLGLILLGLTEGLTVPEIFQMGYGGDSYLFVFFILIFAAIVDQSGLSGIIANWVVSRKIAKGRPWVLTTLILLASYIVALLISVMPAIIITWGILYRICSHFGYTKYDKYPKLMVIGIVFASLMGHSALPFEVLAVMLMNILHTQTGFTVDFFRFSVLAIFIGLSCIFMYVLMCKFIFKPDVNNILNRELVTESIPKLSTYQRKIIVLMAAFFILLFIPGILSEESAIGELLRNIGNTGTVVVLLVFASFIRNKDNTPFVDVFSAIKTGVPWSSMILLATAIPMANVMTGKDTGVTETFENVFSIILGENPDPILVMVVLIGVSIILTNILGNIVVGLIMMTFASTYALNTDVNILLLTVLLSLTCNLSIILPSGSPIAALLHGNSEWITSKDIYKYGIPIIVLSVLIIILISLTFGNLLFK